jgi:DNA-binding LacI/PurR family transcriptional regulator
MVTIKDVAALAQVSPATVSNVLNDRGHVSQATRKRVLQIVQELGYRANIHAQQLVTQRSRIVAIKLPELSGLGEVGIPNSTYFLNIVNAATEAAEELDYAVVVLPSRVSSGSFRRFGIDGFILVDPADHDAAFTSGTPTVTIGAGAHFQGSRVQIDNDHAAALHVALERFQANQKKHHAIVKDSTHRAYVETIADAYGDWAHVAGTEPLIFELESLDVVEIDALLETMIARGVDSVYATSDDIALGLLQRAQERRIQIPDELAIISAVDSLALTFTSPPISAMELFPRVAGEKAFKHLLQSIGTELLTTETVLIPAEFVSRGTV